MKYRNIYQLFRQQTAKYGDRAVFHTRRDGAWATRSWREFEDHVHAFASALITNRLTPGASVAILAGSIPEWTIADIGTIAAGGVGVGIYPTSSPEQIQYIINHSDAEVVFVDSSPQLAKLFAISGSLPKLRLVITLGAPVEKYLESVESGPGFLVNVREIPIKSYQEFIEIGRDNLESNLAEIDSRGFNAEPDETAIMVYTSGTTGNPKGAMLSHAYVLNSVESLHRSVPIFDDDVAFSYLPACHVAERISGIYNRLYSGAAAYFIDDLGKLYEYMLELRPTVFASLPRFFEKIHAKIVSEYGAANVTPKLVNEAFGGRMRLLTSGGAPLPNEIAQFFVDAGLPILQAYGLTENICVAFNTAENIKFGTVGRPMPMCSVRIADDGEILIKSPMMFSGYYKEPEKTAEMFDADGWLKTGDLGSVDDDGFLKITGRKKEIIVLSSGKNVAPAAVENIVRENHLVSQCFLYGDGKSYCVALITLNQMEVSAFARQNGIADDDFAALTRDPAIVGNIAATVEKANARVSSSEQIKRFEILERDFSLEENEITPTMKVKRNVVAEKFAAEIAELYK